MKRTQLHALLVLFTVIGLTTSSCKKLTYADLSSAADAVNVGYHMNAVMEDAANVVSKTATLSGSTAAIDTVAGGRVDTSQIASGIITITYDGTTIVDSRFTRSGSITIQMAPGTHWIDKNAVMNIYLHNVKFTNVFSYNGGAASNHTFTYSGPHTLTNITGGLSYQMLVGQSSATALGAIQYNLKTASDTITFYDDTTRVWSMNRLRTYTYTQGIPEIDASSSFSTGGYTAVDMWGIDRLGKQFYEAFISHMDFNNQNCTTNNFRDARGGEAKIYEQQFAIDMGFGATSPTGGNIAYNCPYGYKTTYVNSRNNFVEAESPYWY